VSNRKHAKLGLTNLQTTAEIAAHFNFAVGGKSTWK